jgi:uncharacterized protein YjbJ (UPF0337 family)
MNNTTLQGNWTEIKGKIKSKWGKLTDNDIETLKGNLDQITGKIQQAYGYAKEKAETEYHEFKQSIAGKLNSTLDDSEKKNK